MRVAGGITETDVFCPGSAYSLLLSQLPRHPGGLDRSRSMSCRHQRMCLSDRQTGWVPWRRNVCDTVGLPENQAESPGYSYARSFQRAMRREAP